jgi:pimeloyl-ACP methyl ester carboxylesterase
MLSALRFAFHALGPWPDLASKLALRLFLTPFPPARPTWERELLESGEAFSVALHGEGTTQLVRCWRFGAGPVVGLVHGWESRGAQLGAFVEPLVDAGFSVVLMDLPGHGDTAAMGGRGLGSRTADVPRFAAAIAAVSDWVGGFHAVVAHSFGGLGVAWAFFEERLRAERVVFIASPTGPRLYLEKMRDLLGLPSWVARKTARRLERRVGVAIDSFEDGRLYRAVDAEVLVVHDLDDPDVPADAAEAIAEHTSGRVRWTEGLGHRRVLKDPAVVEKVSAFIVEGGRPATDPRHELLFTHLDFPVELVA